jgi:hypothetical protein
MAVWRARQIAIEHARQLDVVDVIALALNKTDILDALSLATHAFEFGCAFG